MEVKFKPNLIVGVVKQWLYGYFGFIVGVFHGDDVLKYSRHLKPWKSKKNHLLFISDPKMY